MSRWITVSARRLLIVAGVAAALLLLTAFWPLAHARTFGMVDTECGDALLEEDEAPPSALKVAGWWWLTALPAALRAPAVTVAGTQGEPLSIEHPEKLRIVVDRFSNRLTLYEGEREVVSYPVAVGKPSTPSPPGEWRVIYKGKHWGGGFGTRWLGLNVPWGIYGIHGTNKPGSIGQAASAGCIRMHNRDVEALWDVVPEGTPVVITGDLPEVGRRERIEAGQAGKFVSVLQFRLRQAGFDSGEMDGKFGPQTERAVRDLQAFFGWPSDGVLDADQQQLLWFPQ